MVLARHWSFSPVHSQPNKRASALLGAVKQRSVRLMEAQASLQQQLLLLVAERDALRAERDALLAQLDQPVEDQERAARDVLTAALRQIFPYSIYRDLRPDLNSLNDQDLVDHFVNHGIREGVNLTPNAIEAELQQLRVSLDNANSVAELCRQKSSDTAAQLDLLKDLFVKLTVQP